MEQILEIGHNAICLHQGFQSKTKARGSRMRLYLVKTIVAHKGVKIMVGDQEPWDHKMGARFVVMLPAA